MPRETYLAQDADPSDPFTEARFEQADRDRMAYLDRICKREVEATRAQRAALQRQAAKGGKSNRKVTRTHHAHPARPTWTYCGRRLGAEPRPGYVTAKHLSDRPTCVTCALRLARAGASD